jgi:hypothetical protein
MMMKSIKLTVVTIVVLLLAGPVCAQAQAVDAGSPAAASGVQKAADPPQEMVNPYGATPEQQKRHLELFRLGSKLWPIYCNHCHNAPNPEEQAPYQWDQIMMHMRTLENLPPQDEKAIEEYLKTAR